MKSLLIKALAFLVLAVPPVWGQGRVVFMVGEKEYQTSESLHALYNAALKKNGWEGTFIEAPDENPGRDDFPGLEAALKQADLLVISVRRRAPKQGQLDAVRAHLQAGKPVITLRTSSHAFHIKGKQPPAGHATWEAFDPEVLGGNYSNHYGGDAYAISVAPGASEHPLLSGVKLKQGDKLYRSGPLVKAAVPVLMGTLEGNPSEPVVWTHVYGPNKARVVATSMGTVEDFKDAGFRRLMLNAFYWATGKTVLNVDLIGRRADVTEPTGLQVAEGEPELRVAPDLAVDRVLSDPMVANPLYVHFDERGRMWVVEYRQYPWPAGLKLLSRDKVYRNVYEPAFPPPPPHAADSPFRGKDRISIHEDVDGDGTFESHKVFLDGLNLATAALPGRGGVFVLNPPYFMFYPDRNADDVPDTDRPQMLLSGFGIEDSHAIANNLRWGPDGWIYATQGSTCSAAVVRYDAGGKAVDEPPVRRLGQFVWRYHPESRRFEVFAEGGGNAFGVEFDSKGRVFSGHNGGDTRGFHYVQGGYYQKTFGKHGDLSNPYAFAYFPAMTHNKVERFTHTFEIYEGTALPERYRGGLIGIAPHLHYVIHSKIEPEGSTLKTQDLAKVLASGPQDQDRYFSPVDIQTGPDGALYLADWQARNVNHWRGAEGQTDPDLGRVYRLRAKEGHRSVKIDARAMTGPQLLEMALHHANRWHRETAQRVLGDRKDAALIPACRQALQTQAGQAALEALWALNACSGGLTEVDLLAALSHREAHVRRWAVRLAGDAVCASAVMAKIQAMAPIETDVEVRSQIAATARRWPTMQALPVITALARHDIDVADPHMPLMLWWAIEAHAAQHDAVLALFKDSTLWAAPLVQKSQWPERLMRRWAMTGSASDLLACAQLLEQSPDAASSGRMVAGFGKAFEGRPLPNLPDRLMAAMARVESRFAVVLGVRQRDEASIAQAIKILEAGKGAAGDRAQLVAALGDVHADADRVVPVLLQLVGHDKDSNLRRGAMAALQKYDQPMIGDRILEMYGKLSDETRLAAQALLASRASWATALMQAVDRDAVKADQLDPDTVAKLRLHDQSAVKTLLARHFPETKSVSAELEAKITHYGMTIRAAAGDPKAGEAIYFGKASCGACHTLFSRGGAIGPDLTSYDRSDLSNLLLAVVHPNAEIREGFENYTVATTDGRILSGFKVEENDQIFILRGMDGQNHAIPNEQIKVRQSAGRSLMPEGLLDGLSDTERRDLFAYLASTTPPK